MDNEDLIAPEDRSGEVRNGILEKLADPKALVKFINQMRRAPIDGIDDTIINEGYAAAVWQFRAAALAGNVNATRAMEIWIKWAAEHLNKRKPEKLKVIKNPNAAAFLPREAKGE